LHVQEHGGQLLAEDAGHGWSTHTFSVFVGHAGHASHTQGGGSISLTSFSIGFICLAYTYHTKIATISVRMVVTSG
jgi:hypothetical protein